MAPILGIYASQMSGHLVTGAFESIATVTATGGETSLNFTSIPSTYKSLQVRGIGRENAGGSGLRITLNGDTSSSYSYHRILGDGGDAYAYGSSNGTIIFIGGFPGNASNSNIFSATIIDIIDYASSKNKTVRSINGADTNGNTGSNDNITLGSGAYYSTSAITSINIIFPVSAIAKSTFALYGIKG